MIKLELTEEERIEMLMSSCMGSVLRDNLGALRSSTQNLDANEMHSAILCLLDDVEDIEHMRW